MNYIMLNDTNNKPITITRRNEIVNIVVNEKVSYENIKDILKEFDFTNLEEFYKNGIEPGYICIDCFDDIYMFVHKSPELLLICYANELIVINRKTKEYIYTDGSSSFSSKDMTNRKENIERVTDYIGLLEVIKNTYTNRVLYNTLELYYDTRIFDAKNYQTVIENDGIKLVNNLFRDITATSQTMHVIDKQTQDILGKISFSLKEDNFSYSGNVSYEIYEQFQGHHYATQALQLIKKLVNRYPHTLDHTIYIATTLENECSQAVALNCGGELFYEGDVPKSDKLSFLGKVNKVKIYKID